MAPRSQWRFKHSRVYIFKIVIYSYVYITVIQDIINFILSHIWKTKINLTLWAWCYLAITGNFFCVYPIINKNGVYMWTGTFNVAINKHLCIYNVTKPVTFNTTLVSTFREKLKYITNMFQTIKSSLDYVGLTLVHRLRVWTVCRPSLAYIILIH